MAISPQPPRVAAAWRALAQRPSYMGCGRIPPGESAIPTRQSLPAERTTGATVSPKNAPALDASVSIGACAAVTT